MKCISIQVQTDRNTLHTVNELIDLVRSVGKFPEIDRDEDGKYVNLNFFTEQLKTFWKDLSTKVLNDKELGAWVRDVSIIVCEGDQGWDDYILLYHYDSGLALDGL